MRIWGRGRQPALFTPLPVLRVPVGLRVVYPWSGASWGASENPLETGISSGGRKTGGGLVPTPLSVSCTSVGVAVVIRDLLG